MVSPGQYLFFEPIMANDVLGQIWSPRIQGVKVLKQNNNVADL